eukprot:CAMPEP_0203847200 /NCGR_PEP_ID=MMETSP0359-20131031/4880_1 /ASSEMBLY_ACC=CAM_ASM_000338 /TAXON_ID=268821 /ORGANISM="Scrippsiella Hangoei, Strain SHTV-5" /LENGTH=48 /DNA_ID= /DNA_START= /DNA_END= /DNA_ORIENTATION=
MASRAQRQPHNSGIRSTCACSDAAALASSRGHDGPSLASTSSSAPWAP